jgi:PAS domain S-box-containing protein
MKKIYQLIPSLLVLIVGINISVGIYLKKKEEFLQTKNKAFTDKVTIQINAIRKGLDKTFSSIEVLKYLFEMNNNEVSREEFKNYAASIFTVNTGIKAISWVPKIEDNNRLKFKSKVLNEKIIQDFSMTELDKQNKLITATKRDLYFTVEYIEPLEENIKALGYDIFSNEKRKLTITNAIDNRNLQITPVIKLVQDTVGNSFLGILPVFDYSKSTKDTINFNHVKGLISTVCKVDQLINNALLDTESYDIELHIYDITNGLNEKIYSSGNSFDLTHSQKRIITIGGRVWELNFTPNPVFFENEDAFINLVISLLITLIVSLLILFFQIKGKKNKKMLLRLEAEKKVRRQTERSLLKIEEVQVNILKTAMDGFLMIDLNGKLLDVNNTYCTMSGYNRTELLQMSVTDLKAHESDEETIKLLKKIRKVGEDRFETQHRRKDGSVFDLEISVQCQLPDSEYMVVFLKDITERKKSENLLQESEKKFITLYNNSPDMYMSVSPKDAKILECNNTLLEKTNYTREELIGFPIFKLYHEDCLEEVKKAFQLFVETGKVSNKELTIKTKEGDKIDVSLNVNAVKDETGKILYSISSWRDISETKKTLQEIRKMSLVIEQSTSIIMITDTEGKIEYVNPKFTEVTGYLMDEVLGNTPRILKSGTKTVEDYKIIWDTILAGKVWKGEFINKKKNGELFNERAAIFPLFNESDRIINFVAIKENITDDKKREKTLEENANFIESIINASPDIIYIYDIQERKNVFSNGGIQLNLGYTVKDIKEMEDQVLPILMHPEDFGIYLQDIVPKYNTLGDKEIIRHEYRMKDKAGNWRWLYSKESIFLRTPDGEPKQIFGISNDITERKKVEIELQKHHEHLEELVKERTHELEEKNKKLDRINQLFVGRELRMKELKEEIEKLKGNSKS